MSRGQMDGNELVLMDASVYLSSEDLDLERIHFLKISNLSPDSYNIGQSKQWAWQFDIGARKDRISRKTEYFFEGGIGDSLTLSENLNAYALLSSYAYSTDSHFSLGGKIGLTYLSQSFSLSTYSERAWDKDGEHRSHTFLQLNTPATQNTSLFLEASDREVWALKAGVLWYF